MEIEVIFSKKQIKDILLSYTFFVSQENNLKEQGLFDYYQQLLQDITTSMIKSKKNQIKGEKLVHETYQLIDEGRASIEDFFYVMGENLIGLHVYEDNPQAEEAEEKIATAQSQLQRLAQKLIPIHDSMSDIAKVAFNERCLRTLNTLEFNVMTTFKKCFEKQTGKECTFLHPHFGIL
jgi:hypothetical protein